MEHAIVTYAHGSEDLPEELRGDAAGATGWRVFKPLDPSAFRAAGGVPLDARVTTGRLEEVPHAGGPAWVGLDAMREAPGERVPLRAFEAAGRCYYVGRGEESGAFYWYEDSEDVRLPHE